MIISKKADHFFLFEGGVRTLGQSITSTTVMSYSLGGTVYTLIVSKSYKWDSKTLIARTMNVRRIEGSGDPGPHVPVGEGGLERDPYEQALQEKERFDWPRPRKRAAASA